MNRTIAIKVIGSNGWLGAGAHIVLGVLMFSVGCSSASEATDRTGTTRQAMAAYEDPILEPTDPPPSDPEPTEPPVIGGSLTSCFPQAVSIQDASGNHRCTGIVIASNLVLTAAHCVVFNDQPTGALKKIAGESGITTRSVTDAYVNPSYNQCQPGGETFANASKSDIAVLKVDGNLLPTGVPPARIGTAAPAIGTTLDVVGYGRPVVGERRLATVRYDGTNADGSYGTTGLNSGLCSGDSGAAQFLRNGACSGSPSPVVVGVHSAQPLGEGFPSTCEIGTKRVSASVTNAANAGFIASAINGTATAFNPTAPRGCCTAGTTQACNTTGTQTCTENRTWGNCVMPPTSGGGGGGGGDTGGTTYGGGGGGSGCNWGEAYYYEYTNDWGDTCRTTCEGGMLRDACFSTSVTIVN
jgi:protease YdgD